MQCTRINKFLRKSNKEIFRGQLNQSENATNDKMLQMINTILEE
jgi:hypothetical protein